VVFALALVLQNQEILERTKYVYACFVDLEKTYDRVPREKLSGHLREWSVDGRQRLSVKSLYSCSEVCIRVGGVKSQLFTVGD